MAYTHDGGSEGEHPQRQGFHPTSKQIVSAVLIGLVVLLALLNLDDAKVDFAVDSVEIPLVFVILASALLGMGAGWFLRLHREHRKRDD